MKKRNIIICGIALVMLLMVIIMEIIPYWSVYAYLAVVVFTIGMGFNHQDLSDIYWDAILAVVIPLCIAVIFFIGDCLLWLIPSDGFTIPYVATIPPIVKSLGLRFFTGFTPVVMCGAMIVFLPYESSFKKKALIVGTAIIVTIIIILLCSQI